MTHWFRVASAAVVTALVVGASISWAASETPKADRWRSEGYGLLLQFSGKLLEIFQETDLSCFPVAEARFKSSVGGEALYLIDAKRSIPVLDVDSGRLFIRTREGATTDRMWLTVEGAVSSIGLQRIETLPIPCENPPGRTPEDVVKVFAQTYAENYPFFDLHGVDWTTVTQEALAKVNPQTSRKRLFEALSAMIAPLEDAHTWLETESGDMSFDGSRPDPQPLGDRDFTRVRRIISSYLVSRPQHFGSKQISFAMLPGELGYLRVSSFSDYADGPRLADELAEVDRALDHSLQRQLAGLVIDVRVNDGGSDVLANRIASRLTNRRYVAYSKLARDLDGRRGFTPRQRVLIEPGPGDTFTGPVAVLTSRYSVSAAETFTQALIHRRPAVARIGEPTQGVFSDVLIRALPNGWLFGLPNEIYVTDGRNYDVIGVPPTIDTGLVFERSNLRAGRDPDIETAIEILKE